MSLQKELKKNRIAEVILLDVVKSIIDDKYTVEDVAGDKEYYHLGDVKLTNKDGEAIYLDAKNDGVINNTKRFFFEDHKYFFKDMRKTDGFMRNSFYNWLCVVDRVNQLIYFIDFEGAKKIYRNYREVQTTLDDAYCIGNIMPIEEAKKRGILYYTVSYEGNEKSGFFATDVVCEQKFNILGF